MNKLTFEKDNGVAYFKIGADLPSRYTLPIDSVEMLFTPSGVPVAFRIIVSNLKQEWMDSWQEISPELFRNFLAELKAACGLRSEKGFLWFTDIPGPGLISIEASSYVDIGSNFEVQGIEFLFRSFDT